MRSGNDATIAQPVLDALCDDLNTPKAIAELHALAWQGRRRWRSVDACARSAFSQRPESRACRSTSRRSIALIDARNAARKAKNFKEADRIRDELKAMGIELEDKKDGTTSGR